MTALSECYGIRNAELFWAVRVCTCLCACVCACVCVCVCGGGVGGREQVCTRVFAFVRYTLNGFFHFQHAFL